MDTGLNGTAILLKIGSKFISGETSSSLDETIDMIETTHKHSPDRAKTYIGGEYGGTISVDAKIDPSDSTNMTYEEVRAAMIAREKLAFISGGTEVGDKIISGYAFINSLGKAKPQNDAVTFSVGLQIDGLPVAGTVTT